LLFSALFYTSVYAQDTIITSNNYKYKIGAKFISEKSGFVPDYGFQVYCGGIQVIKRIKHSKFSLETGFYYYNKALEVSFIIQTYSGNIGYYSMPYYYHNLSVPASFRYNTRLFYFTTGVYFDYLLSSNPQHELNASNFINADSIIIYKGSDRKLNFGISFAIGLEKSINKHLNIFVEARLLSNFTPPWLEYSSGSLIYIGNFGFAIGINYKILNEIKHEKN
jgi:hypothetical protein